jgi:two-component system chemotaxis response regulator CheB
MSNPKIKVLIGDNSSFARLVMSNILNSDPDIEVIDTACSGDELMDKIKRLMPDVIYLDTAIVRNDRYFTVNRIMSECRTPLVLSATEEKQDEKVLSDARGAGVREVVIKPRHILQPELRSIGDEIIGKIKVAVGRKPVMPFAESLAVSITRQRKTKLQEPTHLVVIGSSTGGPQAVETIVRSLRSNYTGAVLIAQHMPAGFTKSFAERLNVISELPVEEAEHGMQVEGGKIIVAKGGADMSVVQLMGIKNRCRVELSYNTTSYDKPSVDLLMRTAAESFGSRIMGVILSGMGSDGTEGAKSICETGGLMLAQDEQSSVIFGMGRVAVEKGYIHKILSIDQISNYVTGELTFLRNYKVQ